MTDNAQGILGTEHVSGEEIRQAARKAALAAMDDYRRAGLTVVTWDWANHQILLRSADEILAEAEVSPAGLAESSSTVD